MTGCLGDILWFFCRHVKKRNCLVKKKFEKDEDWCSKPFYDKSTFAMSFWNEKLHPKRGIYARYENYHSD